VTFTISDPSIRDPAFAIEPPPATATGAPTGTVPGATTPTTGVPIVGIALMASGLLLVGTTGLVMVGRRRRMARQEA
jgi:LPXTG-motif cell wall-anchored protein